MPSSYSTMWLGTLSISAKVSSATAMELDFGVLRTMIPLDSA